MAGHPKIPRWDSETDRLLHGGLASSTQDRLDALLAWGGSSSFLAPTQLASAEHVGLQPIGQVVGMSVGVIFAGYVRTTRPGQGRAKLGVARWREHSGPVRSWSALRARALGRLTEQATRLGADAVVAITADRRLEPHLASEEVEGLGTGRVTFSGTAVRLEARPAGARPLLTLAGPQELWTMRRAGLEPAGIAGGFARVETLPSRAAVAATLGRRRATPNVELEDLTASRYEVRRLAMDRLRAEARGLDADGVVGVTMDLVETGRLTVEVHVLASAVRRTRPAALDAEPVLDLAGGRRG